MLRKQRDLIRKIVPSNTEWKVRTEKDQLTQTDLCSLIRIAFSSQIHESKDLEPAPPSDGKMPPVLGMAIAVLHLGNTFEGLQTVYRRVMAITRIVGYALMQVSEVAGEVAPDGAIDSVKVPFRGGVDWHKRTRNLACFWCWSMGQLSKFKGRELAIYLMLFENGGEKMLRELFQPAVPAAAGEFVSLLSSEEYSEDVSSASVPGVIEIVKVLLDGYVSNVIICRALGCPDSYLDEVNSVKDLLTGCSLVRDSLLDRRTGRRTGTSTAFMDMDADPDDTFRYVYSGDYENIETVFSRGYDFSTSEQS